MKFVYVTPEWRNHLFVNNVKEHDLIIKYGQPSYGYVNDKEGDFNYTAFEMDNSFYQSPPYKFDNNIDSKTFSELCYNRACQLRDMDREIEVYEDQLVMQYLREVCPKDQICKFNKDNPRIFGRIIVTPHEYNLLFTHLDRRWKKRVRYFLLTQSWNVLSNYQGNEIPISNFQPFYLHPTFEQWANNIYIEKGPTTSSYRITTYKYECGNILAITSDGKCIFTRRKPVKENNINEYKEYLRDDSS